MKVGDKFIEIATGNVYIIQVYRKWVSPFSIDGLDYIYIELYIEGSTILRTSYVLCINYDSKYDFNNDNKEFKTRFLSISEYREKRINEILNEYN